MTILHKLEKYLGETSEEEEMKRTKHEKRGKEKVFNFSKYTHNKNRALEINWTKQSPNALEIVSSFYLNSALMVQYDLSGFIWNQVHVSVCFTKS